MLQIGSVLRKNIQYDNIHYIWDGQHWSALGAFLFQTQKLLKLGEFRCLSIRTK
jgi:hypothetical protein